MAIVTTSRVLHDGVRNLVMQFTGRSDGEGQETDVVKVDVSELTPPCESVRVQKITYDVFGGLVKLLWAADEPVEFLLLSGQNVIDYSKISGLKNGADDTATGDILLTTSGFAAGDSYTITLEMTKKGVAS